MSTEDSNKQGEKDKARLSTALSSIKQAYADMSESGKIRAQWDAMIDVRISELQEELEQVQRALRYNSIALGLCLVAGIILPAVLAWMIWG